jgi:hypothetical protein
MRLFLLAGTMIGALSIAPASATLTYTTANGTKTFPGTFVGTVGNGATNIGQIGNDAGLNGSAVINPSNNPSIYEFYWTGGILEIQEELANNGTEPNGIDAALFSRSSQTDNSTPLLSSAISQISFPYTPGGPPDPFETVYDGFLAAGYYSLDTYAPIITVDPDYEVTFTVVSAVPEPMSVALFGAGLIGLKVVRRRQSA